MKRSKTPTFVAERRLVTQPWMEHRIDEVMNAANRMYNNGVRHYRPIVENLRNDSHFQQILSEWRKLPDDEAHKRDRRALSQEILGCLRSRGISEYEVHAFMGRGKRKSMEGAIGINILQKVGTNLYQSMEKAVFSGTEIHFRKFGETNTLEEKSAKSGIIYHPAPGKLKGGISPDQEYISFDGMDIPLKGIREKDFWLQDAMKHRIKYLRIVRKPFILATTRICIIKSTAAVYAEALTIRLRQILRASSIKRNGVISSNSFWKDTPLGNSKRGAEKWAWIPGSAP